MQITELFYPEISVELGSYAFTQGVELEVYSDKASYFDWGKVRFTKQFKEKIAIEQRTRATIRLGYNGVFDEVFVGNVAKPYDAAGKMNEVALKDDMMLLEQTFITNTFLEATPQDILGYCLGQAGVGEFKLSDSYYPARKRFAVSQKNVIAVVNELHAAWDTSERFFFSGGVFYWGVVPDQEKVYRFEYGNNIINLARSGGRWELETVSAPFIRHSHNISVEHPQVSGEFEVEKVVFLTNEAGFIRTYIYF